jgi:hypothetical protein
MLESQNLLQPDPNPEPEVNSFMKSWWIISKGTSLDLTASSTMSADFQMLKNLFQSLVKKRPE